MLGTIYRLLLQSGIVRSIPCNSDHFLICRAPHQSSNYSLFIHQSSLLWLQQRYVLVACCSVRWKTCFFTFGIQNVFWENCIQVLKSGYWFDSPVYRMCMLLNDATSVDFVMKHSLPMFWGGFKTQCSDLHGFSALLRSTMPWWLLSISLYCFLNVLKKWWTGCAISVTCFTYLVWGTGASCFIKTLETASKLYVTQHLTWKHEVMECCFVIMRWKSLF
jgi:hypothetical protein